MEGYRAWLVDCIHRIQSLQIVYDFQNSISLSERDVDTVKAMLVIRCGLAYDLFSSTRRAIDAWVATLSGSRFSIFDFEKTLKNLKEDFFQNIFLRSENEVSSLKGKIFSRWRECSCWIAIAPMYHLECDDLVEYVRVLNQWCSFASRLSLLDTPFHEQCLQEFVSDEEYLHTYKIPRQLAESMEQVWYEWLHDFRINWKLCSHGSGACYELARGTPPFLKNKFLGSNARISYLLAQEPELKDFYPLVDYRVPYCNRVQSVPKNIYVNRIVSMEPAAFQFLQHGVERSLREYFESRPDLDAYFHPIDQCVNRRAALFGSATGHVATLDQSKASDMVTAKLVTILTRRLPHLRRGLLLTRSSFAELCVDDNVIDIIHTAKFAPMGSDTCFKTEQLVFGAAIEAVYRQVIGKPSRPGDWSVVGDDIVVPDIIAKPLIDFLLALGFIPNTSKSYYGSQTRFRESCGAECVDGVDITPVRLSRFFGYTRNTRSRSFTRCVLQTADLANSLYLRGYPYARLACLRILNGVLDSIGGIRTLMFIPTISVEEHLEDCSYYFRDGHPKYEWMFPMDREMKPYRTRRFPLFLYGKPSRYGTDIYLSTTGVFGSYSYNGERVLHHFSLQPTLKRSNILKKELKRYKVSDEEVEELLYTEWFIERQLLDYQYPQKQVVDNRDNDWMETIGTIVSVPQRESLTSSILIEDVPEASDTDEQRVWLTPKA